MEMSWWQRYADGGLAQSEFYRQVVTEAARMQHDPKAKHVSTSPHQFRDPPRKRPNTEYGYAAECEAQDVML